MPSVLPVQATLASLTPGEQADLESSSAISAKSSTTSLDATPCHANERTSIIRETEGEQDGAAQIVASVWSRTHLIIAYILIWMMCAVSSLFSNVLEALSPYVTSAFHLHSYAAATGIAANVVGAMTAVPTSKLLQRFGRAQGLTAMLTIWVIGLVMLASCQNVRTFSAAQVFTSIGSTGVTYCISVFVADTTSLRNRGFMMSFSTSPDIVTMWVAGPIAQSLLQGIGWRWGFGIFSIALPAASIPFCGLVYWNQGKARRAGLLADSDESDQQESKDSVLVAVKKFAIEVDVVGILILICGLSIFLLPFTLYSFQAHRFGSPLIISFITVGGGLVGIYVLYERYIAPTMSLDFPVLVDRTALCAVATLMLLVTAFTLMVGYVGSLLQVVYGFTVTETSYLISSIRVAICVWGLLLGAIIHWSGRIKLIALVSGAPLMMIAAAVWIPCRHGQGGIGIMILVILSISFSLGTTTLCSTLIVMAALGQANVTTVLAVTIFVANIAPAVGEAINTGIWTGVFKDALVRHVPPGTNVQAIYSSLNVQLSFPQGSAVRDGIAEAYGDAKLFMLITSLCLSSLAMLTTIFWRDLRVKDVDLKAYKNGRL